MTLRDLMKAPGMRYAIGAVVLGIAATAWAGLRAYKLEASEVPPANVSLSAVGLQAPPPVVSIEVGDVVSADIFAPDRKAPPRRYLLPGESDSVVKPTTAAPPREPPRPVLLGTVVNADSTKSFATLQLGGGRPTNVRIGGKLADFTVIHIEQKKVTVLNAAGNPVDIYTQR